MSEKQKIHSILEIMNGVLGRVRNYYDSEYVYYIEKDEYEILTIYEWCAENVQWQRDRIKLLDSEQWPKWVKQEILDTTEESYSVHLPLEDGVTAVLAAVQVHRGGCTMEMLQAMIPMISQTIVLQKMQKQQEYLSYHDDLTGLMNRNSFVAYLAEAEQRNLKSLGALSVDINGLKNFNKEFGRDYGDEVVIRVGEILEEYFRPGAVYRLTGDEYMAIAEDVSYEAFMKQVNSAHDRLENISLGLTTMGYAWEKVDIHAGTLISDAENMMRDEKQKYYKHLKKGHHEPIIKKDLLTDLENGSFIVCLLPIMDAESEEAVGAEAVVRYHHKDLGVMNPGRYITLLEETKLSHYLDIYVFEEVCKTLARWDRDGLPMLPVSVNFAGATLRHESIADQMLELVEKYQVPCEYLEVEVSESGHGMNQEMLAETSNKIRKANIRVTLDHFGEKNSSFSILSIMEFDGLKLDKGIVSEIVSNSRSQIVTKAVIDICRRLGARVTAAGVETQDQLNMLRELGCEYVQGTLFNKPITIDTFETRYMR